MKATKRERQVLRLIAQGKTNRQIADELAISTYTVRDHVSALLRKQGVHTRMELCLLHLQSRSEASPTFVGLPVLDDGT
jgi:DNA-binding NarL/FixJ family response regulator